MLIAIVCKHHLWNYFIFSRPAVTVLRFSLSEARTQVTAIPQGKRATAGDNVFFATDDYAEIAPGQLFVDVPATCTELGTVGNQYMIGKESSGWQGPVCKHKPDVHFCILCGIHFYILYRRRIVLTHPIYISILRAGGRIRRWGKKYPLTESGISLNMPMVII
mgnify:CR=1 FL=1